MTEERLGKQERLILELLKASTPPPMTEGEMRIRLDVPTDEASQFGRRRRELNKYYQIDRVREGKSVGYVYRGPLAKQKQNRALSQKLRVEILTRDGSRCQMCGRSPRTDATVTLEIDHKVPGGPNTPDNLWTLCHECNHGKKDLFASFGIDPAALSSLLAHSSVHVRIGELLKLFRAVPVPSFLIELVANQSDWKKRLRELRYVGWEVRPTRRGRVGGRVQVTYELVASAPWPPDPTGTIRRIEKSRSAARRRVPRTDSQR